MVNEPGPRGSIDERRPPRGPGNATIDHHLTALVAEQQGVARPTTLVARMKKKLPYLFISAWFFASGFSGHVGALVGGVLLSLAILLGTVSAIQGESRRQSAVAVAIAVILQIGSIAFYVFVSTTEAEIAAASKSGLTIEKLAERALNSPVSRGRELAASYAFREFAERIPYSDESGKVRTFEPTSIDLVKQESNRKLQLSMADTHAVLRQKAMDFRWAAFAYLFSLAGALIGGAIVLGGARMKAG